MLDQSFPDLNCDSAPFEILDAHFRCFVAVTAALRSGGLGGICNDGARSAGIKVALEQLDPGGA